MEPEASGVSDRLCLVPINLRNTDRPSVILSSYPFCFVPCSVTEDSVREDHKHLLPDSEMGVPGARVIVQDLGELRGEASGIKGGLKRDRGPDFRLIGRSVTDPLSFHLDECCAEVRQ